MKISAATAYTPSVQKNTASQPSFNRINRNFGKDIMEYLNKGYGNLPPMSKGEKMFLAGLIAIPTLATIGVFATYTNLCKIFDICLK